MTESYNSFMVYSLDDSGERQRLEITEQELETVLEPEEVFVIVNEDIRRIFIWKGAKSPVRKRFISSRVASSLQDELVKIAAFHRCKIVSVDQGDEVEEFLKAFGLESMEVTEKLADMRYVRNIEREGGETLGKVMESESSTASSEHKEYFSPALRELERTTGQKIDISNISATSNMKSSSGSKSPTNKAITKKIAPSPRPTSPNQIRASSRPSYIPYSSKVNDKIPSGLSEEEKKKIIGRILKIDTPPNYKRQNLIFGNLLYGAVTKKVNVFGKTVEETEWESLKSLPKGMIQLDDHILRIYFNDEKGIVEALEILSRENNKSMVKSIIQAVDKNLKSEEDEKREVKEDKTDIDYNSWTVKELKEYAEKKDIDIPSKARKAEIIDIIEKSDTKENSERNSNQTKRRKLPEIPKG